MAFRARAWEYMSAGAPIQELAFWASVMALVMRSMYLSAEPAILSTSSDIRLRVVSLGTIFLRSSICCFRYSWDVWRAVLRYWFWKPKDLFRAASA